MNSELQDLLKKVFSKRCECGAELPQYPLYSETHEIYRCPKCKKEYTRERFDVGNNKRRL